MKTRAFRSLICIAVTTALAATLGIPVRLAAQDTESLNNRHHHVRYTVKILSTVTQRDVKTKPRVQLPYKKPAGAPG